jgi:hypothetical protein
MGAKFLVLQAQHSDQNYFEKMKKPFLEKLRKMMILLKGPEGEKKEMKQLFERSEGRKENLINERDAV